MKDRENFENNELIKQMGERLKALRLKLGLNQDVFADQIGHKRANYSRVERGQVKISSVTLFHLFEKFNVDLNYMVTGEGELFRDNQPPLLTLLDLKRLPARTVNKKKKK
jgi:transcriptional regulator with XRE-family HTH domain